MFEFLLIVQTLVAIGLITVILMQRSEGGGFAGGGSPSGLMTARGAADFLTRATTILATVFIGLSIVLAALAASAGGTRRIDSNSAQPAAPTGGGQLGPAQPGSQPAIPTLQPQGGPAPAPAQGQPAAPAPAPAATTPAPATPAPAANKAG